MHRFRSGLSTALLVLVGVIFPIGVLAAWAGTTIYDSDAFSHRSVQLLDSPAVRREVADRLTEQLARAGNEQAIAFRPAAQLAIEAVGAPSRKRWPRAPATAASPHPSALVDLSS